jgi:cytochrome P450
MSTTALPSVEEPIVALRGGEGFVAPARRIRDLPGPPRLPLVGNALDLKTGASHVALEAWAREYGPMFRFRIGRHEILGLSEPTLINEILRHRPRECSRNPRLAQLMDELGSRGVFTAEGESWRRQRRLVMRALRPEAVKHFFPVIRTVTERLERQWRAAAAAGRAVDVVRDLKRYSIDVTTWLAMGIDVDTLNHPDNPLQEDVEYGFATIGRRLPKPFPYWRWIRLPADRKADAVAARLRATVTDMIAKARARLDADPSLRERPGNILEALIVACDEPGSEFTDEDVRGNVGTMLFAGEDTTANAMAWLLHALAVHPGVADDVRMEADALLGDETLVPEFGLLDRFERLEAAAIESMRLRPVAPINGARANVALDLAGLEVPKGSIMLLIGRPIATDARHFVEPFAFRPERWRGAGGESADDTKRKIFPFGGGPRYCPGRYLAMVEIKIVTAMALRNFAVALDIPQEDVREFFTFTMGPATLPLRLEPRTASRP